MTAKVVLCPPGDGFPVLLVAQIWRNLSVGARQSFEPLEKGETRYRPLHTLKFPFVRW